MSDEDSSSSEDIPLSALGAGKRSRQSIKSYNEDDDDGSSDEAEFRGDDEEGDDAESNNGMDTDDFIEDDDEDDDNDDGGYSDSSEDVPLSSLKKSPSKSSDSKTTKKTKAKSPKSTPKAKATPKKKTASAKKKKTATKSKPTVAASSTYISPSSELYAKCEKGKLIQSVLARWWYAYQWPDPACIPTATPKGYDALDGFPGVYICTQGSDVGAFKDVRDMSQAPSFQNFAKKKSEELKDLLLVAIEKQRKALIKMEGEGTGTEKELRDLEKWAMKLNCSKADKDAEKVLKAKKLKLT